MFFFECTGVGTNAEFLRIAVPGIINNTLEQTFENIRRTPKPVPKLCSKSNNDYQQGVS